MAHPSISDLLAITSMQNDTDHCIPVDRYTDPVIVGMQRHLDTCAECRRRLRQYFHSDLHVTRDDHHAATPRDDPSEYRPTHQLHDDEAVFEMLKQQTAARIYAAEMQML
jgi:hypothetical protein